MKLNPTHLGLLRLLEQRSNLNQRDIASELEISLGKAKHKMVEYDQIKKDIKELDQEVQRLQELGMLSTTNVK
jgi:putative heme degradation protein